MRPSPFKSPRVAEETPFAQKRDHVIARITRRSYQLRNPRKRRGGVRGARGHQAPGWTRGELKLLGTRPDAEIAKLTKLTFTKVMEEGYPSWLPWTFPMCEQKLRVTATS